MLLLIVVLLLSSCRSQKTVVTDTQSQGVCFFNRNDSVKVFLSDRLFSAYRTSVTEGPAAAAAAPTTKNRAAVTAPRFSQQSIPPPSIHSQPDILITHNTKDTTSYFASTQSENVAGEPRPPNYSLKLFVLLEFTLAFIAVTAIVCLCLRRK